MEAFLIALKIAATIWVVVMPIVWVRHVAKGVHLVKNWHLLLSFYSWLLAYPLAETIPPYLLDGREHTGLLFMPIFTLGMVVAVALWHVQYLSSPRRIHDYLRGYTLIVPKPLPKTERYKILKQLLLEACQTGLVAENQSVYPGVKGGPDTASMLKVITRGDGESPWLMVQGNEAQSVIPALNERLQRISLSAFRSRFILFRVGVLLYLSLVTGLLLWRSWTHY